MGNPLFEIRLPYHTRCNLPDCNKSVNRVFRLQMTDGTMCNFCTPGHANVGRSRFEDKLKNNIRMGVDSPSAVAAPDMVGEFVPEGGDE